MQSNKKQEIKQYKNSVFIYKIPIFFQAPEPFGKWEGTRDATKEGADSLQFDMLFKSERGEEDCLYLNVYSTKVCFVVSIFFRSSLFNTQEKLILNL